MAISRWTLIASLTVVLGACHSATTRPPKQATVASGSTLDAQHSQTRQDPSAQSGSVVASTGSQHVVSGGGPPQQFLLIDGVAMQAAMSVARRLNPAHRSLYTDLPESTFGVLAPHLFAFEPGSPSAQLWMSIGRGRSWGLQLVATASIAEVVAHLQRFLLIEVDDTAGGDPSRLYLRFYDPRVMHTLLKTLDAGQRAAFFGPIKRFIVEDDLREDTDVHYSLGPDGTLATEHKTVVAGVAPPIDSLVDPVEAAREGALLRADMKRYGQLTALSNAGDDATPFCSVCSCNEFEVKRAAVLSLSPAQNMQFSAHALRWYRHRVFAALRARKTGIDDATLRALVTYGNQRAEGYGITNQRTTYDFIELMVDLGRDFDTRYPWAQKILTDSSLHQDAKIERLQQRRNASKGKTQVATPP